LRVPAAENTNASTDALAGSFFSPKNPKPSRDHFFVEERAALTFACIMNASPQPFTDHVTGKNKSSPGAWVAWIVAVLMAVAAAISLGLWNSANAQHQKDAQSMQSAADALKADLASARAQIQTNQNLIASLTNQIADLQKQKEEVSRSSRSLEDEMRSQLESRDVTISKLQGRLTVNIVDRVMFDSGEAVLKPDGEVVMRKIAQILQEHPQLAIHVVGHTDNVPIRQTAQSRFASNWELSVARALAAVHFLTERAGVDPHRVGAVGYGEFRPVADNSTPEGRAKNRRIAITILPEELTPTDAPPVAKPAETNLPPGGVMTN
jgi:chemotaxis protein MotB